MLTYGIETYLTLKKMGERNKLTSFQPAKADPLIGSKAMVVFDLQAKFGIVFGSFCLNGDPESTLDHVFLLDVQRRMGYGKYVKYHII